MLLPVELNYNYVYFWELTQCLIDFEGENGGLLSRAMNHSPDQSYCRMHVVQYIHKESLFEMHQLTSVSLNSFEMKCKYVIILKYEYVYNTYTNLYIWLQQ